MAYRNSTDIIIALGKSCPRVTEFEFALGGRTNVPATKLADLIMLTPDELKRQAKSIKAVEKRFVDILSRSIEQPGEIGKLVREVDVQVFSNDYEWRNIFKALNQQDEDGDELRRVAIVKYMQYLRSRQDVIKQTYKVKQKEVEKSEKVESKTSKTVGDQTPPMEETKDFLKETNIFDSISVEIPQDASATSFIRLPKGEAIHISPYESTDFEMKLSKHHFVFRNGEMMEIVDEHGSVHQLNPGKNIVGRDSVCNVVVTNSLRDVSRMHLITEPLDDGTIRLTEPFYRPA